MSADAGPDRRVVAVGLMGAGKTSVGRLIAARLGWRFDDSDETIGREFGQTVREISDERGVEFLHDLERRHLLTGLGAADSSVLAAAASVIDRDDCLAAMRGPGVAVIWMRAQPATLAARFANQGHRPTFGEDPAMLLTEQAATRYPRLETVNPIVFDVEGRDPEGLVELALAELRRRDWPVPDR